jgi:TetR/AcrR family transcriptional repressor of mexJK operon
MNVALQAARKGRKYDQVLAGARQIFLAQGYEGANVDDIARAANVSKATLYSYFADKRLLFLEVAKAECCRQADEAAAKIGCGLPAREALLIAGHTLVGFFTSDFFLRIYRIFVAESERFPDLGQEYYNSGPALGRERMVEYLHDADARGELRVDDKDLAAEQFAELCKAVLFSRRIFGIADEVSQADKDRVVNGAVDMFMARYGVKG